MAKKHLMIAIDWYGPYTSIEDAKAAAKIDYDHGLYMAIGKTNGRQIHVPGADSSVKGVE